MAIIVTAAKKEVRSSSVKTEKSLSTSTGLSFRRLLTTSEAASLM